ncbi:D-alanyl-D-alanine carboxypeptidase, partial [Peribacillus sp. SIMBA_075]
MTKLNKVTLNKRLLATGFAFIILCAGLIGFSPSKPSVANAATVTYTATANLNVRTGPSTANKIIA